MTSLIQITPVELVLRVASATIGASETPAGSNAGPYVERLLKQTGNKAGDPWCAAYVTDIGVRALGSAWPVKRSASVMAIAEWAKDEHCRLIAAQERAAPGDLFCLHFPSLNRLAHIGFVVSVADDGKKVVTVEGNTSGSGSREGWLVASRTRVLTERDRLVRWAGLVP